MDTGYKLLFSNPRLVQDLLEGFIQPDWLGEIDFGTLEPVKASFATDDLRQRHDDSIWRVRLRGERWLYLYLLLEFQARDDHYMACRIMTYVGLLYQDIIRAQKLRRGTKLPPVLPVVIYSGSRPWRAPEDVQALVEPVFGSLQDYVPSLKYYLLEEQLIPERFAEEHPDNILGHVIGLGFSKDKADMRHRVQALNRILSAPAQQPLARAVTVWLNRLLRVKFKQEALPEVQSLSEVDHMLAEKLDSWTKQWKREGLEEGRKEGRRAGAAELLEHLVERRHGPLTEAQKALVEQASLEQIQAWVDQITDGESPEAVFGI